MHANVKVDHVDAQQHTRGWRGCMRRVAGMQWEMECAHDVRDAGQRVRVNMQLHCPCRHAAHDALRIRVCMWLQ